MRTPITAEKLLIIGMFTGMLAPLTLTLFLLRIASWSIPGIILIFLYLYKGILRRKFRIQRFDLWEYCMLFVMVSLFITTLLGENMLGNIPLLTLYLSHFILAFYFRRAWGKTVTKETIIRFALIAVFIQSVIGITQQVTFTEIGNIKVYFGQEPETMELRDPLETEISRVHGTLGVANLVGNWLNVLIPFIVVSTYYSEQLKIKHLWFYKRVVIILGFICMVFTLSRANIGIFIMLGTIAAGVYYLPKLWAKYKVTVNVKLFIFRMAVVLVIIGIASTQVEKILALQFALGYRFAMVESQSSGQVTSLDFRLEMDKGAIEAFSERPLFGIGFKNSRYIWPTVSSKIPRSWSAQPHNILLVMAVEGGVFTMIAYGLFMIIPVVRLVKYRKKRDPLLYAFLTALVASGGFSMIYLTLISTEFASLHMVIQGAAMGYIDSLESTGGKSGEFSADL